MGGWRERMGIEPTRSLFPDPSLVLKTRPGTSRGHAPVKRCREIPHCDDRPTLASFQDDCAESKRQGESQKAGTLPSQ